MELKLTSGTSPAHQAAALAQAKLTLRQVVEMFDKADAEVKDSEYAWTNESVACRLTSIVWQLREASKD